TRRVDISQHAGAAAGRRDVDSLRLSYLSQLARTDALAVVVPSSGDYSPRVSHNVPPNADWLSLAMILDTSDGSTRAMASAQPLADGRTSDVVLVTPILWQQRNIGTLVGLRVGETPDEDELTAFARVADLMGLELAETPVRGGAAQGDDVAQALADRQQAILLYEIARFALSPQSGELEHLTAMLAGMLEEDLAAIWSSEGHQLHLTASTG